MDNDQDVIGDSDARVPEMGAEPKKGEEPKDSCGGGATRKKRVVAYALIYVAAPIMLISISILTIIPLRLSVSGLMLDLAFWSVSTEKLDDVTWLSRRIAYQLSSASSFLSQLRFGLGTIDETRARKLYVDAERLKMNLMDRVVN